MTSLVVTGAQGRIGRLLKLCKDELNFNVDSTDWTSRLGSPGSLVWDLTAAALPPVPQRAILLHLAAALPGRGQSANLADNIGMAKAISHADRSLDFQHVLFLSTVAVYAPQSAPIMEDSTPNPQNDYGRTKLAAEHELVNSLGEKLTILRLANLVGADALLGERKTEVTLDPVDGQKNGPERSYIGPLTFVRVIGGLLNLLASGAQVPSVINVAQPKSLGMADLLRASARPWKFGPPRSGVVPKVEVDVTLLAKIIDLPRANALDLVAELDGLKGKWP